MAKRPKLVKVDAEMQRWCALLLDEVSTWPDVTSRPMFGMVGLYRGKNIFAAVPRTRAPRTPFSVLVKLPGGRRSDASVPGAGWVTFEMESSGDTSEALRSLARAYDRAKSAARRLPEDKRTRKR
ncbi:MAG: hypothetical protein ACM30E_09090 [Nitrososphaerales archaeon]